MPLKDAVKISRKTFFNPRGWFGYDLLKSHTQVIWGVLKNLFSPASAPRRVETFTQAMERLRLAEADIQQVAKNYFLYSLVFAAFGAIACGFSFYLLIHHGTAAGWILGLASSALCFVYSFRYHFWVFQIKQRKLGCTFKEWWRGKLDDQPRSPS